MIEPIQLVYDAARDQYVVLVYPDGEPIVIASISAALKSDPLAWRTWLEEAVVLAGDVFVGSCRSQIHNDIRQET